MAHYSALVAYQESAKLAAEVHTACKRMKGIAASNAAQQMVRAAESIPSNIAEGMGKGVSRDCVRFLRISRTSAQELNQHLVQAELSGRLPNEVVRRLLDHTRRVRYLLRRLQESVERRLREDGPYRP